jgi:RNA polymerase sigma-70 factor (ECF subfamily)
MELTDLLVRASARESQAWEAVVRQYGPLMWRLLQKFRNLEREALEDLFQDIFTVLLNGGLKSFRGSSEHEFRAYLRIIVQNEAKSCLRKHGRKLEVFEQVTDPNEGNELLGFFEEFADSSPGPDESAANREIREKLDGCIQQIELIDQEVFWMRERGLAYKEITETLGLPQGTVASKYHRAKEALSECLRKAGVNWLGEK